METENKTIVAFHIGRGGKFHNQGFLSFIGKNKIGDFTDNLFLNYENLDDVKKAIKDRPNLEKKFDKCLNDDNFSFFEKLGFDFGEKVYFDGGGNQVELTEKEEETGIGRINIDHDYDTTYTTYLDECDQKEVEAILNSSQWNSKSLLEQFFAENDVKMDWVKFNGSYSGLITDYFHFEINVEDYYEEETEEEMEA